MGLISMTKPGVEALFASSKKVGLVVRVLPAFNDSVPPTDPAFKTSWAPYRDRDAINPEKGTPMFTRWAQEIRAYRFFGKSESSFISPSTMAMLIDDPQPIHKACPIMDLRKFCSKHDQLKHLVDKDGGESDSKYAKAIIPASSKLAVFGVAYVHQQQATAKVALQFLTMGGMMYLRECLDWPMTTDPQAQQMRDEAWPDFLLGDITAPNRGARAFVVQRQIANVNAKPWCLQFTAHDQRIGGFQAAPISPEVLAQRYDFLSPDVLNIPTYQEIVDFLHADGIVPRDVIAYACGGGADVSTQQPPTFAAAVTGFPGPAAGGFGGAPAGGGFGAPAGGGFGAPAPAFGGAPAGGFGGAPAGGFGGAPAGGFGGAPAPAFGGAPAGGGFGAPAPAFGGAPAGGGFGGAPAGDPAGGFGAGPAPQTDSVPFSWGPPAAAPTHAPSPSPTGAGAPQSVVSTTALAPSPTVAPLPAAASAPQSQMSGNAAAPEQKYHVAVNKEVLQNIPEGVTRTQIEAQMPAWAGGTVHVMLVGDPSQTWRTVQEAFGGPDPQAIGAQAAAFGTPVPTAAAAAPVLAPLSAEELAELTTLIESMRADPGAATDAAITRMGDLQLRGAANRQITV